MEKLFSMQNIEAFRESCPAQAVLHGGMGFAFGGIIGLFLSSLSSAPELTSMRNGVDISSLPLRSQVYQTFKDMGLKSWSSAKNFGIIGLIFSGSECVIETYRAKHDIYNTIASGCFTGGVLSAKSGPKAALFGCAGFAAFSAAIEHFLQDRSEE